jgi:hypothetical protein
MRIRSSQPPFLTQSEVLPPSGRKRSACQQFLLGSRKLFIRQHTRIVKLGKLLKLGCQIGARRCRSRRWWGRRIGLLLGLCIGCALLISLINLLLCSRILLLRSGVFLSIFLLLVVADSAGCTSHNCCAYGYPSYASPYHSSSHHFDLLVNFSIEG